MNQTTTHLTELRTKLHALATPAKAKTSAWFFKTGPGEYAEGDQFLGITVPEVRQIARAFSGSAESRWWRLSIGSRREKPPTDCR